MPRISCALWGHRLGSTMHDRTPLPIGMKEGQTIGLALRGSGYGRSLSWITETCFITMLVHCPISLDQRLTNQCSSLTKLWRPLFSRMKTLWRLVVSYQSSSGSPKWIDQRIQNTQTDPHYISLERRSHHSKRRHRRPRSAPFGWCRAK